MKRNRSNNNSKSSRAKADKLCDYFAFNLRNIPFISVHHCCFKSTFTHSRCIRMNIQAEVGQRTLKQTNKFLDFVHRATSSFSHWRSQDCACLHAFHLQSGINIKKSNQGFTFIYNQTKNTHTHMHLDNKADLFASNVNFSRLPFLI